MPFTKMAINRQGDSMYDEKDLIIQKLKERGCRITKQRRILIDIILEGKCTRCKEIYYEAVKKDSTIGMATVYRMIDTLEEIGTLSRNDPISLNEKNIQ
jgi:Fur family ferric uptake transcriptional regulator